VHNLSEFSLEELTRNIGENTPGSIAHGNGMAELTRRQYIATLEATGAQKAAVDAARTNARYMLASVVVATIAAAFSALSALATAHPAWFK